MKPLPLTLQERALARVLRGACTRIRRPADGVYFDLRPGARLWIREPFYLGERFEHVAPSQAYLRGADPLFSVASDGSALFPQEHWGNRRPARTLLREWHRFHARVTRIEREPVLNIDELDAQAEGFASREDWLDDWDAAISSFTHKDDLRMSRRNPEIIVITLAIEHRPAKLPPRPRALARMRA